MPLGSALAVGEPFRDGNESLWEVSEAQVEAMM